LARLDWSRGASLAAIFLGYGSTGLGLGVFGPLLVPISTTVHNEQLAQTIIVTPMLGLAITGLAVGWITGRLGVRYTLCAGAAGLALAGVLGIFGAAPPFLIAASFLVGASTAILSVAAGLLLSVLYDGEARTRVLGYAVAFGGLIAASAVWLSGQIADSAGWRAAYLLFVAAGALICLFALGAVRAGAAVRSAHAGEPPRLSAFGPVVPYFAAIFLLMLATSTTQTHVPLLLKDAGVRRYGAISAVLSMQAVFNVVGSVVYARLPRLGRIPVAIAAVVLLVTSTLVFANAHAPLLFAAGCAFVGAAGGMLLPFLMDGLFLRASLPVRGYALGVFRTLMFTGGFLNPFVMKPIRNLVGLHNLFYVLATASAVVGSLFILRAWSAGASRLGHLKHDQSAAS